MGHLHHIKHFLRNARCPMPPQSYIQKTYLLNWSHAYLICFYQANFVTGAQIQLVSKASGHTLHIVQAPSGELLVEGKGEIGPEAWNGRPYRSH